MYTHKLRAWLACLVPAAMLALFIPFGIIHSTAFASDEWGTPKFASGKADRDFKRARQMFLESEFKDARIEFATLKDVTNRKGKKNLDAWIEVCAGGEKLARIEKGITTRTLRKSYERVRRMEKEYADSPLAPRVLKARRKIEGDLFFPLSTFENNPPSAEKLLSARTGSGYNSERKYVRSGRRSARWDAKKGTNARLHLASFDGRKFSKFRLLHVSLYAKGSEPGKATICLSKKSASATTGRLPENCFAYELDLTKQGWQELSVLVQREFTKHGSLKLEDASELTLLWNLDSSKTIYIDDVRLER